MRTLRALQPIFCLAVVLTAAHPSAGQQTGTPDWSDPTVVLRALEVHGLNQQEPVYSNEYETISIVFLILFGLLWSAGSLLAIWAAFGRGHWAIRSIAALAPVMLLFLIGASDLVAFFLIHVGLMVAILNFWRFTWRTVHRIRGRHLPATVARYSVRDAMALFLVLGLIFAAVNYIDTEMVAKWRNGKGNNPLLLAFPVCASLTGLAACCLVFGPRRRLIARALFSAACIGGAIFLLCQPSANVILPAAPRGYQVWLPILSLVLTLLCLFGIQTSGWLPYVAHGFDESRRTVRRRTLIVGRMALVAAMAFVWLPLLVVYGDLIIRAPIPPMSSGENHFSEIVETGKERAPWGPNVDIEELADVSVAGETKRRERIDQAGQLVRKPWRVQLSYSARDDATAVLALRGLQNVFATEFLHSDLHEQVQRGNDLELASLTVALKARHDGELHFFLHSLTMEREVMSIFKPRSSIYYVSPSVVYAVQKLDDEYPENNWLAFNRAWEDRALDWPERVYYRLARRLAKKEWDDFVAMVNRTHLENRMQLRLFLSQLALRQYQKTHADYPETLDQLVPEILPRVPLDPFSDKPLVYRRHDTESFMLYSVGPDGVDNGGLIQSKSGLPGDFLWEGIRRERE